mgnify:FL=1
MATKKVQNLDLEEKKKEAEKASNEQMSDLYDVISSLGTSSEKNTNSSEIKSDEGQGGAGDNFKTVTTPSSSEQDDKPGYVSLVIPNSLKKKWKLYSAQHEMSLTDSLKLGMKLLEQMENQGKIKIEGGFLTINS